ncbi:MAG TPA: M23 family metallopeptidase [Stellaceae bacterium]
MISPRRIGLHLALLLTLLTTALAACARTAPPAPVTMGQSREPRVAASAAAHPPANVAPALPHAEPVAAKAGSSRSATPHPDHIIVRRGETLYAISRRYDVPVRSLIEANGLTPPYALPAGRRLVVPQIRQHVVQPGETLYSVSRLYGVDASTLARSNGMAPPFTVVVGQALVLPAPVQPAETAAPPGAVARSPAEPKLPAPAAKPPRPADVEPAAGPLSRSELAALPPPTAAPRGGRRFLWPVRGRLIGHYGTNEGGTHNDGINIAARAGTPVVAAEAGTVAYAGNELRGYGNLVLIKHANGWMTAYAHNSALLVKRGERVRRGQPIGRIGATGAVSEPQLHFEIRRGSKALDPDDYLPPLTTLPVNG